jgi:hypothetical protein
MTQTLISRRAALGGTATLASWLCASSAEAANRAPQIRVGLIGCPEEQTGPFASLLDAPVQRAGQVRLAITHVWDPDVDRAAALAKQTSATAAARHDQMEGKVDGIVIGNPRAAAWHDRLVRSYLLSGVPVWIDGPLGYSIAKATTLLEAARQGRTAVAAATVEEFLPTTRYLARKAQQLAPLTAAMAVLSTRRGGTAAGLEAVNFGAAVLGPHAAKVSRVVASAESPNYAVALEYHEGNGGRPLHAIVHGMPAPAERIWARLYGNDMVDQSHVLIDEPEQDWLNTFLPAALEIERLFTSRKSTQPDEYLLAKTRLYLAALRSSLVPDGKQYDVASLDAGWEAENPHPDYIPSGYFS